MSPRIPKLEALLARIQQNAAAPRVHAAVAAPAPEPIAIEEPAPTAPAVDDVSGRVTATPPPPAEAREVEAPLESRARLVAAPRAEAEVEEIEAEEVLELDERHIVQEDASAEPAPQPDLAAPPAQAEEPEAPPPSSRRPIAEPAETPQEAQIQVAHTPPPESGKQVAAEALSFDDDFTGVREAAQPPRAPAPAPEPSIQLQSLRMPAVKPPVAPDEMEAELPPAGEETRPPPGPLPEMRAPRIESVPKPEPTQVSAEVTRPTRPVAAAQVAELTGTVKPESPRTFGELLDLTLSL